MSYLIVGAILFGCSQLAPVSAAAAAEPADEELDIDLLEADPATG